MREARPGMKEELESFDGELRMGQRITVKSRKIWKISWFLA